MEAIFTLLSKNGKGIPLNPSDWTTYMLENDGEEIYCTLKQKSKVSPKMRLYAYLFGPLMSSAVAGFYRHGYPGIDKVSARYKLQAEFAKAELFNEKTGQMEFYLEDLSSMTKARLLQFVTDCVLFIENNLEQKVPDSAEYKAMKGDGFMSVKFKDNAREQQ